MNNSTFNQKWENPLKMRFEKKDFRPRKMTTVFSISSFVEYDTIVTFIKYVSYFKETRKTPTKLSKTN